MGQWIEGQVAISDAENEKAEGKGRASDSVTLRKAFPTQHCLSLSHLFFECFYGFIVKNPTFRRPGFWLGWHYYLGYVWFPVLLIPVLLLSLLPLSPFPEFSRWWLGSLICNLFLFNISIKGDKYPCKYCFWCIPMAYFHTFVHFDTSTIYMGRRSTERIQTYLFLDGRSNTMC